MIIEMANIFHISHDELFIGKTEVLSFAMNVTTIYISTFEILTWHFTFGLALFTIFWMLLLFVISRWIYIYLDSPNDLLDIYHNKVVIKKDDLTVQGKIIKRIDIKKIPILYRCSCI
jgi:membrane protein implicated in regulation of membrane protease activity